MVAYKKFSKSEREGVVDNKEVDNKEVDKK